MQAKASIEDLSNLEQAISANIDSVITNVNRRFADRQETKSTLKEMGREVKQIFDIVANATSSGRLG